jgi:hypothetical protein
MIKPEEPQKKRSSLSRLPKLSRVSQLMLVVGIFLILFIPLWIIYQQQPAKQAELKATLSNLQKILSVQETPKGKLEAELKQVDAETETAKAVYPDPDRVPEIIESLLELAELNGIYITQTKVSTSQPADSIGQILTFNLNMQGQVPMFQNFLLALYDKFPTHQVKQATFTIAQKEGEKDAASLTIDILCYEKGEQ